jgi:hypothetical protein
VAVVVGKAWWMVVRCAAQLMRACAAGLQPLPLSLPPGAGSAVAADTAAAAESAAASAQWRHSSAPQGVDGDLHGLVALVVRLRAAPAGVAAHRQLDVHL